MHSLFEWHIRTVSVGDPSVRIPRKKQIPIQKHVFRKRGYDPWRQDFTNIAQLKNRKQHLRQSVRHTESPNPQPRDPVQAERQRIPRAVEWTAPASDSAEMGRDGSEPRRCAVGEGLVWI